MSRQARSGNSRDARASFRIHTEKLLINKTQLPPRAAVPGTAGQSTALVHMGKIAEERIMSDDKANREEPDRSRSIALTVGGTLSMACSPAAGLAAARPVRPSECGDRG